MCIKEVILKKGILLLSQLKIITDDVIYQLIKLAEIYPSLPDLQKKFYLYFIRKFCFSKRKSNVIESIINLRASSLDGETDSF